MLVILAGKEDFSQQQMKDLVLHLQCKKKDCEEMVIIVQAVTSRACVRQKTAPWVFRRSVGLVCFHCIAEALEGVCGCYIEVVVSQKCMINFWRCFLSHPLRSRCQTKMLYVNFTSDSHWRLKTFWRSAQTCGRNASSDGCWLDTTKAFCLGNLV